MQQSRSLSLTDIIAAIQELSPSERRQLLRRLHASGLVDPDELLTDQRRLDIAPALGTDISRWQEPVNGPDITVSDSAPASDTTTSIEEIEPPNAPPMDHPAAESPLESKDGADQEPEDDPDVYRSSVSGKVVIGSPGEVLEDDPYAMHPVPGQAPEQPIVVIFDGGSKGNPGRGYGSYALRWPGQREQIVQLQFGDNVTNNEAEYDTLIAALETILARLDDLGAGAATAQLAIYGDSLLVVNQVKGEWKCNEKRLQMRRDRARELLSDFGRWELVHHDRSNSVKVLGH